MHPPISDPAAIEHDWDERYSGRAGALNFRTPEWRWAAHSTPAPGRVLDVGCGEGADAVWLAENGWNVTALDVSGVALDRAEIHARLRDVQVTWLHSGLVEANLPSASFDLVSAQYPALLRTADHAAERALLGAVAPGGILLVVHHPTPTEAEAAVHGFHPDDYVGPADVAARLGEDWLIEVDETRPRHVSAGAGAHHTEDVVLRVRRLR
jgi:SAM-dependent methyltransferase